MRHDTTTKHGPVGTTSLLAIRSTLLRSVLLLELHHAARPMPLAELCAALQRQGFTVEGRISKVVSDTLRTELAYGRVFRPARGVYRIGPLPRTTRWRCRKRVEAARAGHAPRRHLHRCSQQPPAGASGQRDARRHTPSHEVVRRGEEVVAQRRNGTALTASAGAVNAPLSMPVRGLPTAWRHLHLRSPPAGSLSGR